MSLASTYPGGVWVADFEFHPKNGVEGNLPEPVCMVAINLLTGELHRIWKDDLLQLKNSPFPTDGSALFVAFYASAEMGCFLALGWTLPENVLDLFVEFRRMTNGKPPPHGNGLLGALMYFGISGINSEEKTSMRDLVLSRGTWSATDRQDILQHCESDARALAKLLPVMESHIDLPRALLRGEYMTAAARIESIGVPIDLPLFEKITGNWESINDKLIALLDKDFGVYQGGQTFKATRFEQYLANTGIPWKRLQSGALDMADDTFREMARFYPQIESLRELRIALSKMRLATLSVGKDARNRCMLSAFSSTTGRNQPSNSKFIFGPATWIRGLIKPAQGFGLAYVDWSQQEFGIAAALSSDKEMMEAYASGDPYLTFAIQAGAAPGDATKQSHKAEREQFKAAVLAVQYGMGPASLALRINKPIALARQLLDLHRTTFRAFWNWSDCCLNEAVLGGKLWTNFGWEIQVGNNMNERSLRNFPMQAHGAEMLRITCILLTRAGIRICALVHDAILIEAPLDDLDSIIEKTQELMREASRIVLSGFELFSEAKAVRYPDRYMDERGLTMWNTVMNLLNEPQYI